jgi:hypothetical protein
LARAVPVILVFNYQAAHVFSRHFVAKIFAVQHVAPDRWLVWVPDDDPFTPAVHSVAIFQEPDYAGAVVRRGGSVIRFDPNATRTRAEIGEIDWRELSPPDHRDPERYFEQRSA